MKFILFCVTLDLSDNLTEMHQISLSWKTWTHGWSQHKVLQTFIKVNGNPHFYQIWHGETLHDVADVKNFR